MDYDVPQAAKGLTGLQNIGNTCYMNAALQALSNCPPLTQYFLTVPQLSKNDKRSNKQVCLAENYQHLLRLMWSSERLSHVTPAKIYHGVKVIHPAFRGYTQQDTQEFLRCFIDQLHEELKTPVRLLSPSSEESRTSGTFPGNSDEFEHASVDNTSEGAAAGHVEGRRRSSNMSDSSLPDCVLSTRRSIQLQQPENSSSRQTSVSGAAEKFSDNSIISATFDGRLLSSVKCLVCNTISATNETFQDLSLAIPTAEHLNMLRNQHHLYPHTQSGRPCGDVGLTQSWLDAMWSWTRSLLWGPVVSLDDCLAAFFAADELKGDNMYSCGRCKKLRNGVKYAEMLHLPEILCVHLKRFRHDSMFGSPSKISTYIQFPLRDLELGPYLHARRSHAAEGTAQAGSTYDLVSLICHHGVSSGGHYTAFARNELNDRWYEYDDSSVTEVDESRVAGCEAYVLFYRKRPSFKLDALRVEVNSMIMKDSSGDQPMQFLSVDWLLKLESFAEPGPINNYTFLCQHGKVVPALVHRRHELAYELPAAVSALLFHHFGGGPVCDSWSVCDVCAIKAQALQHRREEEMETVRQLQDEADGGDPMVEADRAAYRIITVAWVTMWDDFVVGNTDVTPPNIDNSQLLRGGPAQSRKEPQSAQMSLSAWRYLQRIYGGGPELLPSGLPPPAVEELADSENEETDNDP